MATNDFLAVETAPNLATYSTTGVPNLFINKRRIREIQPLAGVTANGQPTARLVTTPANNGTTTAVNIDVAYTAASGTFASVFGGV